MKLKANDGYTSAAKQESCQVKWGATSFLLFALSRQNKSPGVQRHRDFA